MTGHVVAGSHEGASLDALDRATLIKVLSEIDDDSRDLLAAYLNRREPGWREARRDAGADARPASAGKVTEEEAYQILGLQPEASPEEIRRAHRSLIKKLHPDQGGTTYLAARINEAKDSATSPASVKLCVTANSDCQCPLWVISRHWSAFL